VSYVWMYPSNRLKVGQIEGKRATDVGSSVVYLPCQVGSE